MNAPTKNQPVVITAVEERLAAFAAVLPPHIPAARFVAAFKTRALTDPDILRANPRSVVIACMQSANDGLLPDGKDAAIVIRNGAVQYQRMQAGLIKLLYRTGRVASVDLQVVREGDQFDYGMGDSPFIHHKPTLSMQGDMIAAYSVVTMKDGTKSRCIMGYEEIERLQRMSPAGWDSKAQKPKGIWAKHPGEMWKKTVLHRHIKILPLEELSQIEPADEIEEIEEAAWLEPEDYGSQPDSGAPTSRTSYQTMEEQANEMMGKTPPDEPEVIEGEVIEDGDDWANKIYALDMTLADCADIETLEAHFNDWDAEHAEQPAWVWRPGRRCGREARSAGQGQVTGHGRLQTRQGRLICMMLLTQHLRCGLHLLAGREHPPGETR